MKSVTKVCVCIECEVLVITFCAMYLHRATNASSMLEGGHTGFGNVEYRSADRKVIFFMLHFLFI